MDKSSAMLTQKPAKACYDAQIFYDIVPLDYLETAEKNNGALGAGYKYLVGAGVQKAAGALCKNLRSAQKRRRAGILCRLRTGLREYQ